MNEIKMQTEQSDRDKLRRSPTILSAKRSISSGSTSHLITVEYI